MRTTWLMKLLVPVMLMLIPVVGYALPTDEYLVDVFTALAKNFDPIWQFISALSYVMGIFFIGIAIFKLKQYGQMTVMMATHATMGASIAYFAVGAGLLFIPTLMDVSMMTVWDYGTNDIRNYDASDPYSDIMGPVFDLVKLIGYVAFVRGWVMLVRLGSHGGAQPGTTSKALIHMVGGILGINIVGTVDMLKATFGLT